MEPIDFLKLLEQGAESWNQWRKDHPTVQPDLSKAYLFEKVLVGFDLRKVNFERACLIGAVIQRSDLHGAQLVSAYANNADFEDANLMGANLTGSSFSEANFSGAVLSESVACGTNFSGACFTGVALSSWRIDGTTVLRNVHADYLYLVKERKEVEGKESVERQRQPQTGHFQAGAIEPFLRLIALDREAVPTVVPGLVQPSLRAIAVNYYQKYQKFAQQRLTQQQWLNSAAVSQLTASASQAKQHLYGLLQQDIPSRLGPLFQPDSAEHVTPGAIHQPNAKLLRAQLTADLSDRLHIQKIRSVMARGNEVGHRARNVIGKQCQRITGSSKLKPVYDIFQTEGALRVIYLFQPDTADSVTVGSLSTIDKRALAIATVTHLKQAFSPDGPTHVTPGALSQISPERFEQLRKVAHLEVVLGITASVTKAHRQTSQYIKALAARQLSQRLSSLSNTRVGNRLIELIERDAAKQAILILRPDSPQLVTKGLLDQAKLARLLGENDQGSHLFLRSAGYLSILKQTKTRLKQLYKQHPFPASLSIIAALTLLALNLIEQTEVKQTELARTKTEQTEETTSPIVQVPEDAAPTFPATPAPALEPASAIEVASFTMPCQEARISKGSSSLVADPAAAYQYENGATYYGAIKQGQPADGKGVMIYSTGNRYEGDYQNGQRHGCGTFSFANGRQYIGQFEADEFSGKGTWVIENGERYIGEFKNNRCNGQGTFIFANGSSKSGTWRQGKLLGSELTCDRGNLNLPSSQDM